MTAILSSGLNPENGNVWRVTLTTPAETHFEVLINLVLLENQTRAVLAAGRLTSLNQFTAGVWPNRVYSVDFGFPSPATQGEQTAINTVVAAHNPAALTPEQQEAADLAAELADIQARIDETNANIALITTASTDPEAPLGYREAFKPANYNPLNNAQKLALIRASTAASLKTDLDTMRAVKYLLRRAKQQAGS